MSESEHALWQRIELALRAYKRVAGMFESLYNDQLIAEAGLMAFQELRQPQLPGVADD